MYSRTTFTQRIVEFIRRYPMIQGLTQRLTEFTVRHPMIVRVLIGVVLYALLGVALWWFISPGTTTQRKDFAQLLAQIAGGVALLLGLYFAWRRVELQQDQQITERFTRAIDQLGATTDEKEGKPKLEIRLGGIYALERIARDSFERDYMTIMEVLTAYVRENASLSSKGTTEQSLASAPQEKPRADIQAILDVLKTRQDTRRGAMGISMSYFFWLDLRKTNLSGADLSDAHVFDFRVPFDETPYLRGANLSGADLSRTNLRGTNLLSADLSGADLSGAEGLTQEQLKQAIGDETTKLPEGLERPKSWPQKA